MLARLEARRAGSVTAQAGRGLLSPAGADSRLCGSRDGLLPSNIAALTSALDGRVLAAGRAHGETC